VTVSTPEPTFESFRTRSGVSLRLTRWSSGRGQAVLVVPGILMHRESLEIRRVAERLAATHDVVTMDVRGHGDSGGLFTWGQKEPDDVAEVAAALRRDYQRVGGLGFSFGGYHTAVAAALHRPFDAVALVAAPHRLFLLDHNLLGRGFWRTVPHMIRRFPRRLPRFSPTSFPRRETPGRLVHRIAPVPLLVAHGTADWLVPTRHARLLYARAGEPKSLLLVEGGLHAEYMLLDDPEPLLEPLVDFFTRALASGPEPPGHNR
jgi:pimeloyl-ACP methyl ester carboxylesterase